MSEQPWQSKPGVLDGPQWPVTRIMDEIYHALGVLPRRQHTKHDFYSYLNLAKGTFNIYLAAVGMPWTRGSGPPPKEHLVLLFDASTYLLVWVSASVCTAVGRSSEDIVGHRARDVLRQGQSVPSHELEFARIMQALMNGREQVGEMSTYILAVDGSDIPLHLSITYGAAHNVIFVDATIQASVKQPDLFNVEPGVVPREYALVLDRRMDVKELLDRYLPPYRYSAD